MTTTNKPGRPRALNDRQRAQVLRLLLIDQAPIKEAAFASGLAVSTVQKMLCTFGYRNMPLTLSERQHIIGRRRADTMLQKILAA